VLVDTAGLRRKRKQRQGIDYYTELRALDAAERADVALVLIDSHDGIVEGDVTAVEVARKSHCSTLVVLSKWDISEITIEDVRPELQRRFRQRPSFITISSETGRGVSRLLDKVAELYDTHVSRVPTGELNRFLGELKEMRQPPSKGGRRLNLLYGAQVATRPPRFRFIVNDPGLVTRDYGYWGEDSRGTTATGSRTSSASGSSSRAYRWQSISGSGRERSRRRRRRLGDRVRQAADDAGARRHSRRPLDDRRGALRAGRPRRDGRVEPLVRRGARPRPW